MTEKFEKIVFGGGCFWCIEAVFLRVPGVKNVVSGYAGGEIEDPDYESVCGGKTGHAEVVEIEYDKREATLEKLLEVFFAAHDPTTLNRQGNDVGTQYRSAIFYTNDAQKIIYDDFMKKAQKDFDKPIITEVRALDKFYPAEEYHQKYFDRNSWQPYCQVVVAPKLKKVMEKFGLV